MDVSILQHKQKGFWRLLIIDHSKPGTHENYNVVYNSACNKEFFKTFAAASAKAIEVLKHESTK